MKNMNKKQTNLTSLRISRFEWQVVIGGKDYTIGCREIKYNELNDFFTSEEKIIYIKNSNGDCQGWKFKSVERKFFNNPTTTTTLDLMTKGEEFLHYEFFFNEVKEFEYKLSDTNLDIMKFLLYELDLYKELEEFERVLEEENEIIEEMDGLLE